MEIDCPTCAKPTLFIKEAVYDGFTKTGEVQKCTVCGHEIDSAAAQASASSANQKPELFSDDDTPEVFRIEGQDDDMETCRHCEHYVANPFTQRCAHHNKEVSATDTCGDFERATPTEDPLGRVARQHLLRSRRYLLVAMLSLRKAAAIFDLQPSIFARSALRPPVALLVLLAAAAGAGFVAADFGFLAPDRLQGLLHRGFASARLGGGGVLRGDRVLRVGERVGVDDAGLGTIGHEGVGAFGVRRTCRRRGA